MENYDWKCLLCGQFFGDCGQVEDHLRKEHNISVPSTDHYLKTNERYKTITSQSFRNGGRLQNDQKGFREVK